MKQCNVQGCKRTGETQRSYFLCAEHWTMMKLYSAMGDEKATYMLHHAGHGTLNAHWLQCLKEIAQLAA